MPQPDRHGADHSNRLLGTTQINLREFAWALVAAIALPVLWELGKLAARGVQAGDGRRALAGRR
jgi:P-type Ca2+ transporter type 2C